MEDHETYSPKEKYRRMFDDAIGQRMGSMALWRVLDEIGFFTSPASTKYHLSVPGGLLQHSINVAEAAMELCETPRFKTCDKRAVFVAALLHDVCKAGKYIEKPGGGYRYEDTRMLGHGEESVILIQRWLHLTDKEVLAIRWHMGAYDTAARTDLRDLSAAMDATPWVWRLHEADMCAAHIDERDTDE